VLPRRHNAHPRELPTGQPVAYRQSRSVLQGGLVSIVMGLDQHRAQITAEWIETQTGEISRAKIRPADRETVREFLEQFAGRDGLEVALEATTGWRFVAEELHLSGSSGCTRCSTPRRPSPPQPTVWRPRRGAHRLRGSRPQRRPLLPAFSRRRCRLSWAGVSRRCGKSGRRGHFLPGDSGASSRRVRAARLKVEARRVDVAPGLRDVR
jgi:hypothetical protein